VVCFLTKIRSLAGRTEEKGREIRWRMAVNVCDPFTRVEMLVMQLRLRDPLPYSDSQSNGGGTDPNFTFAIVKSAKNLEGSKHCFEARYCRKNITLPGGSKKPL